jgi:hypothetical protein
MREERAFHRSGASRPDSDHLATGREEIALALGSADAIHDLTGRLARGQGRYALGASACEQPPRRPGLSAPIMDKRERGRSRVRRGAALSTFAPGRRPKGAASLWSRSCTTVEHSAICGPEKRRRHLPADPRVIDDFAYNAGGWRVDITRVSRRPDRRRPNLTQPCGRGVISMARLRAQSVEPWRSRRP